MERATGAVRLALSVDGPAWSVGSPVDAAHPLSSAVDLKDALYAIFDDKRHPYYELVKEAA